MARGKREPAGHRGGDARALHGPRGGNDRRWEEVPPEDDPLCDLRPHDEETDDPVADEYIWPDLNESEDDD